MTCAVKVKNLWWKYEASRNWVLKEISIEVKQGEFIGIIGPSGAGKTTLCLCIAGIIPNAIKGTMRGKVKVFGKDTKTSSLSEIMKSVGIVFQDPDIQFVTMRVMDEVAFTLENLGVPRDEMIKKINRALTLVGMKNLKFKNPLELSGGQKQRVAIASMIARQPKIMILDEPTSDLDPQGKQEVYSVLHKLKDKENLTVILVSHDIEELAKYADRIIFIKEGKIVKTGSPKEIFTDSDGVPLPQVTELYYKMLKAKGANFCKNGVPLTVEDLLALIGRVKAKNLRSVYNADVDVRETVISLEKVFYRYPDGTEAIRGINLEVRRGEFLTIIGPNGSGKTTLLKLMVGLLKPTRGTVKLFGVDTRKVNISDVAFKVGFVYQNPDHQLFCNTVYEECAYALRNANFDEQEIQKRIEEALRSVGLLEVKNTPPYFLSKGERQRLAVATVLVMKPEVIIVDEPTTGQDYGQSRYIMNMLKSLNESGKTIIVVTHNMRLVAEYAKRVVILMGGKVIADGPVRDVIGNVKLLEEVSLNPPQVTLLTLRLFGIPALTVDEALSLMVT